MKRYVFSSIIPQLLLWYRAKENHGVQVHADKMNGSEKWGHNRTELEGILENASHDEQTEQGQYLSYRIFLNLSHK
jgi:hypothetical protein